MKENPLINYPSVDRLGMDNHALEQAIKFLRSLSLFRKSANAATAVRDLHLKVVLVSSSLYFPFEESVNMCCPPLCPFIAIRPIS